MADKAEPTKKRLRLSRNKKKTWRKLSRDVDNLLPEQTTADLVRRRSGGFYIDVGEPGQRRRQSKQQQRGALAGSATSRILSGLRCHESLKAATAVKPVESKRQQRFNSRPLDRRVKLMAAADAGAKTGTPTAAEGASAKATADPQLDLWADQPVNQSSDAKESELQQLLLHHMRCTKRAPVKRRFRGTAGSAAACQVPQSGASYNPSLADHQALLASATQAELDKEAKAERLHRQLERHFPSTASAAAELMAASNEEMAAGLFESDSEDEQPDKNDHHDGAEKDEVSEAVATTASPAKKPAAGRSSRKQNAEVRRQRALAAEAKRLKRQSAELDRLPALRRQVGRQLAASDRLKAARQAKRRQLAESSTRRLGRQKFEEPEVEFKLAEELAPSLRQLRPEGDLFVDAVKSFQRRSMLEPRTRAAWRHKHPYKRYRKKGQELENPTVDQQK